MQMQGLRDSNLHDKHRLNDASHEKEKESDSIIDWLMTHAAFVSVGSKLLIKNDCDNYKLAKSSEDLILMIKALRSTFSALKKNGHSITPSKNNFVYLPVCVLLPLFKKILNAKIAEISMSWHCKSAPDEFIFLESELKRTVQFDQKESNTL